MTTVEVVYENGIFKPVSSVPSTLKEHERMRIIIEDIDEDLRGEFKQWDAASDDDFLRFERNLEEKS